MILFLFPSPGGGVEEFARMLVEERAGLLRACPRELAGDRDALAALTAGADAVLLHYVGYGFARRGAPWQLVGAICDWRRGSQRRHLVTLFHEVYAFGPPWRSSFWISPLQRYLARRLAQASGACVTSNEPFAAILRQWVPPDRVHVLPVFSTIGEPEELAAWADRSRSLVVFGSPGVRERAYHETRDQLSRAVAALGVEEILDIGAPAAVPKAVSGAPVRALGHLPPAEVRSLLGSSRFGFVAYPPRLLGKSSVFAAYEAHGLCPVVGWPVSGGEAAEGEGVRWLPAWGSARAEPDAGAVAEAALAHYATHSLDRHAELHRRLLAPCAS